MAAIESVTRAIAPAPHQREDRADGGRVQMVAVRDEFDDGAAGGRRLEAGGDGAGAAVVRRRHGVEEVGHGGPLGEAVEAGGRELLAGQPQRGGGRLGVGVGVADGGNDAVLGQLLHEPVGVGQLGRVGHGAQLAAGDGDQLVHEVGVRIGEEGGVLRAAAGGGQERPLGVDPLDQAVLGESCQRVGSLQHGVRGG